MLYAIGDYFRRYFDFKGVSSRGEYWWSQVFWWGVLIATVSFASKQSPLTVKSINDLWAIFALATIVPQLSVSVRRHHDAGWSGWWMLIPIWNGILMFFPSKLVDNKYDSDSPMLLTTETLPGPKLTRQTIADRPDTEVTAFSRPEDASHPASSKKRRRAKVVASMIALGIVAGITLAVIDFPQSNHVKAGPTPATIYRAMNRWCGPVLVFFGVAQVQAVFSGIHPTGATDAMTCSQHNINLNVLFFRTAFDESAYLQYFANGMYWQGAYAKTHVSPVPVSVGQGFVAYLGWPKKATTTTEGIALEWMTATFGADAKTSAFHVKPWSGVLPVFTLKSIRATAPRNA